MTALSRDVRTRAVARESTEGKPFALIGVNSDTDLGMLRLRMRAEKISWRSFWCGPMGGWSRIPSEWGVRSWPTIYVIDHKGVIRYRGVHGKAMDEAVDKLLAEEAVERAKKER